MERLVVRKFQNELTFTVITVIFTVLTALIIR